MYRASSESDGGEHYLQIFADLINRPRLELWPRQANDQPDSLVPWRSLVDPFLSPVQRKLHRRFAAVLYVVTELARWSRDIGRHDVTVVSSSMTDIVEAILRAEVSPQTRTALREHDARHR